MSSFDPQAIPGLQLSRVSADGSTAVFTTAANGIVPGDTDGRVDIFVQDLASGQITLVQPQLDTSLLSPSVQILNLGIDGTGDRIAVHGLVARDGDVVVFDLSSGQELQVDTGATGRDLGTAFGALLSPLGNYINFGLGAQATVNVLRDLSTGEVTFTPLVLGQGAFSADGLQYIYTGADGAISTIDLDPPPGPLLVTTTLDFEGFALAASDETKLEGYGGFTWSQAAVVDVGPTSIWRDGSGYTASSGDQIGFIAEAGGFEVAGYEPAAGTALSFTSATAFNLVSASFAAAFRDGVIVTVRAFADEAGTEEIGSKSFAIDRDVLSLIRFDDAEVTGSFADARRIEFASNDGDSSTSDYFGFDDLTFSRVVSTDLLV